ncbi:MAG: TPM domain-containing protein [Gammaproteobacteria bacterium]|jgi:uncharacterized protein
MHAGFSIVLLLLSLTVQAAPQFPPLSGRVVDEAGLLSTQTESTLSGRLAGFEQESGTQVVVVTLKSLQSYSIEEYGYQLGRHWGIGQKGENNGVLLIVAPNERKVRIEVGYGLEGVLTDAISHSIIQNAILPNFKANNYERGIVQGADAILLALGGQYKETQQTRREKPAAEDEGAPYAMLFFVAFILGEFLNNFIRRRWLSGLGIVGTFLILTWLLATISLLSVFMSAFLYIFHISMGGSQGRGGGGLTGRNRWYGGGGGFGGGSFGGGGGFSGGGGSFGGGGSSGSW